MVKQCLLALTVAGLLYTVTPAAVAQDGYGPPPETAGATPERAHGGRHFDPEKRSEMMAKHLNLSADQQSKVKDILSSEQSEMQKLHQDSSLSQEDRRSKMMDIHKTSNDQIRALLNPDQQKKFDEMQTKREKWMQNNRGAAPGSEQK